MRRPAGRVLLAAMFAAFALNALAQVALALTGRSSDPPMLTALQIAIGLAGTVAAWGCWTAARWVPVAALLYGVATAAMLLSLGPLLEVEDEARRGLWTGAVGVMGFSVASAWYLRRLSRGGATPSQRDSASSGDQT